MQQLEGYFRVQSIGVAGRSSENHYRIGWVCEPSRVAGGGFAFGYVVSGVVQGGELPVPVVGVVQTRSLRWLY